MKLPAAGAAGGCADGAAWPFLGFPDWRHSSKRCITTKKDGTKATASTVEAIMPLNTQRPRVMREAAPAPAPTQTPAETSPATPAADAPCRDQIGEAAATRLAERCRMVSPATHPPCNAANPCALIQNEIDRSCAMWKDGENPPKECEA